MKNATLLYDMILASLIDDICLIVISLKIVIRCEHCLNVIFFKIFVIVDLQIDAKPVSAFQREFKSTFFD